MFCIILKNGISGEGVLWHGRRSVEVLSYHHDQKRANILFGLFLENTMQFGEKNYLEILHPGNVTFKLITKPFPFPKHPDENDPEILTSVYGNAFDKEGCHVNALAAWDMWYPQEKKNVNIWPYDDSKSDDKYSNKYCPQVFPDPEEKKYKNKKVFCPFTVARLGPFEKPGPVLIVFEIYLEGNNYDKLIGLREEFTVDGPETLMFRVKDDFLKGWNDPEKWTKKLEEFYNYIGTGESYDVLTCKRDNCDDIEKTDEFGIFEAPIQPPDELKVTRYITCYPRFCLVLRNNTAIKALKKKKAAKTSQEEFEKSRSF